MIPYDVSKVVLLINDKEVECIPCVYKPISIERKAVVEARLRKTIQDRGNRP